jgi:SWI/SNF-related matrix-associated actin-dependent regulator 1 of chromatin subfamily A
MTFSFDGAKRIYGIDREYQLIGSQFLVNAKRGILHMDPGLGKTMTVLRALKTLGARRILCIAGENPQYVWIDEEIPKWEPDYQEHITAIRGTSVQRQTLYRGLRERKDYFAFATMQALHRDYTFVEKLRPDVIIYDEAHKAKNRKTLSHKVLKQLVKTANCFFPMSGHIVSKGPADLWALLHCIDPKAFPSFWDYVNQYCHVVETQFGLQVGGPKNVSELKTLLEPFVYYKTKEDPDIKGTLPPKTRQPLPIKMTKIQSRLYQKLATEMMAEHGKDFVISRSQLGIMMRLRQMLVCPRMLFEDADLGGAVLDTLERLEETPHAVIFSPFTSAFPYISEELRRRKYPVSIFQGGMKREEIGEAKQRFVGERGVALMSISYAESISLESSPYGYFLGPDLDQNVNFQAEERLHRMTSTNPVWCYYYDYKDSNLSDHMFSILGWKTWRSRMTNEAMSRSRLIDLVGID